MKSKAIFMALLAFAFGAQAVPVSRQDVTAAAQAWARSGTAMGLRVGSRVIRTDTVVVTNDLAFYVVSLDGGTIVMSGDDDLNPVVMFSSNANLDLSDGSPLVDLLTMDGKARSALHRQSIDRTVLRTTAGTSGNVASSPSSRVANRIWRALIDAGKSETDLRATSAGAGGSVDPVSSVDDVRVAPLVDSKWDQTTDRNGRPLYNYYTPEGYIYGGNYPCGCTATALAQIMRKYRYPTAEVEQKKRMCSLENESLEKTTRGGVFKWDDMPANPNVSNTDVQREAVGHLTYDVAVLLRTAWSNAGGGSAYLTDTANVLVSDFGYANAFVYSDYSMDPTSTDPGSWKGGLHNLAVREKTIYANLDAGRPVELGIHGFQKGHIGEFPSYWAGHAVIGDGYGFKSINGEKTAFVHINMGWSGLDDLWYNIPEINAANSGAHVGDSGYDFCYMAAVLFNISPTEKGDLLTGRVVDMDEVPVGGALVEARNGGEVVATTETDKYGIYAFILAGDKKYEIAAASTDGSMKSEVKSVTLSKTTADSSGHNIESRSNIGNSWGNDLMLEEVVFENSVKNANTGSFYGTLDAALAEASADDTLEILSTTLLRNPQTIDKSITIRTADGVSPSEALVNCRVAAAHGFTSVTNGATLALENVVFANTKGCFVHVHSNAFLSVAGTIGLSDGSYVHTEDEKGIQLAGELESYLTVDCLVAKGRAQQFGTCSDEAFAASASHFLNPYDEDLGGEVLEGKLIWARVPVDPSIAIAYFTGDAGDSKQYYRKLTTLFEDHAGKKGDVVILKDCELKASASVTSSMRLVCTNETGAATVTYAPDTNALISVEAEASLSVSNVVLSGATYRGAILVRGGGLTLESDTVITNCVNSFHDGISDDLYAGAGGVTVSFDDNWNPGHATVMPGALITMCQTVHGAGGGIFVEGDNFVAPENGCSLDLRGGTVENCSSSWYGGGVCAQRGTEVLISGDVRIRSNVSEQTTDTSKEIWDNLFVADASVLTLAGALTGVEPIGLRCGGPLSEDGDYAGDPIGLIGAGLGVDQTVTNSATLFRSDDLPNVWHGAVGKDKGGNAILVWDDSELPEIVPIPEDVAVRVIYEYGGLGVVTNLYDMLDKALASIHEKKFDGPVTVELCADHDELVMSNGVNLVASVVIKTEDNPYGKAVKVIRPWNFNTTISVLHGADLLLTNVWLYGGCTATVAVRGGALTMESGATISDMLTIATNIWSREHCGVCVGESGTFKMRDGAEIACCTNLFESKDGSQLGPAGGVVVEGEGTVFNLEGGWIHGCAAGFGGGVSVSDGAAVYVSGKPRILDNYLLSDPAVPGGPVTNANLSVASESSNESSGAKAGRLILAGEFSGAIGVLEPRLYRPDEIVNVDTNVFGRVAGDAGDLTNLVNGASLFHRDAAPSVTGLIVTNADSAAEALLVWSSAVNEQGVYVGPDGQEYAVVQGQVDIRVDPPTAVVGLIYNGQVQTGVVESVGFTLTGNFATEAGDYVATATLLPGYVWSNGTYEPLEIEWTIAEDQPEPPPTPPDPPAWDVITNYPTPIAFKSIERISDTEWTLTVTSRVPYCNYRLIWTTDLTKGFTSTGAWEHAVGPAAEPVWTTNVLTTGGAWFWRAEGTEGTNMVPHQVE